VRQIHSPVLWVDSVRHMVEAGVGTLVEIGPGRVLGGLCKRIEPALECHATEEPADLERALEATA
jgi:[acyl-carrier-protein] S-malonyltransferase